MMTAQERGEVGWPVETDRLILRPVEKGDKPHLIRLWTSHEVRHHLGGPLSIEDAVSRADEALASPGQVAVVNREDGAFVGLFSLQSGRGELELSYQVLPEHWSQGLALEAAMSLVRWAFGSSSAERVIAVTQASNSRSRRLLERLGMRPVDQCIEFGEMQVRYALERAPLDETVPSPGVSLPRGAP